MRISDWSSDVCASDLTDAVRVVFHRAPLRVGQPQPAAVQPAVPAAAARRMAHRPRARARAVVRALARRGRGLHGRRAVHAVAADAAAAQRAVDRTARSEEHTSELQSLMRISYAVFCLKKKNHSRSNTSAYTNNPQTTHQ